MEHEIKVAHLSFSGAFGGREKVAFSLVQALGTNIHVKLYLIREERAKKEQLNELMTHLSRYEISVRVIRTASLFSFNTLRKLHDYLCEDHIQILHCHCHKSLAYALLIRSFCRKKIITTVTLHGLKIPFNHTYLIHHLSHLLGIFCSDGVIGCSKEIVSPLKRIPILRNKVTVIQNNLVISEKSQQNRQILRQDFINAHNIPKEKCLWVGNASRLTPQKNIFLYLDVIHSAKSLLSRNDVVFLLAGDGELKHAILQRAKDLHIEDLFCYVGFLTDIEQFYSMLDLFVLTSDWEGTPMVLLEAMDKGVPVVASNVGGVADVVGHGITGYMYPANDIRACRDAILDLIENKSLRERMGLASKERICAEFTEEKWVAAHKKHYIELLRKRGAR